MIGDDLELFQEFPRPWSIDGFGHLIAKNGEHVEMDGLLRIGDGRSQSNRGQRLQADFLEFINGIRPEPRE